MPRKCLLSSFVVGATAVILVTVMGTWASPAQPSLTREVVVPPGSNPGTLPFSPAIKVGNIIYVSGQIGGEAGPGIREQSQAALRKVQTIVEAAGSSLAKTDKCSVFLTHQEDFATMNEVWRTFFSADPPARSTVIAAALANPAFVVEIECMAHT